jgi:hypothetical protein
MGKVSGCQVREKPIIFSTPMVRAILEGRKTQTRRVVKPHEIKCPWQVGGLLWVRETFAVIDNTEFDGDIYPEYKADKPDDKYPGDWPEDEAKNNSDAPKWKPSIHMPKKYARIWLEITDIRVERLQDISDYDCAMEGIPLTSDDGSNYRPGFKLLWDQINGKKHPWASNPWVWVIGFKRRQNAN